MLNMMIYVVPVFFLIVFILLLFFISKGMQESTENNLKPVIPVSVLIVSKRVAISHNHNSPSRVNATIPRYFIGVQYTNGEMQEFVVSGIDYEVIETGAKGVLSFQGSKFIDFERELWKKSAWKGAFFMKKISYMRPYSLFDKRLF